ncbi:MAG TPA: hypothetical protein VIB49_02945 [Thermoplasmata archaeon]|jgi:hypothetical protein
MVALENVVLAAVSVFAIALTAIAVVAWRRAKDYHLLFLGGAFGVFAGKAVFLTVAVFGGWADLAQLILYSAVFDLATLGLFYGFTLRR